LTGTHDLGRVGIAVVRPGGGAIAFVLGRGDGVAHRDLFRLRVVLRRVIVAFEWTMRGRRGRPGRMIRKKVST
jgi:hypothetical protein